MNKKLNLAVAGAVMALGATAAHAGIIIPAGDWTLDIGGNVNTFYTYTDSDDAAGAVVGGVAGIAGADDGQSNITTGLLTAYDDVGAIFTINDPSAIGADLAAKQLNRTGIVITTVDGSPDVEEALKRDTLIEASSAQLPSALARAAVEAGAALVNGETLEESSILVAPALVTRDNVGDYKGWNSGE